MISSVLDICESTPERDCQGRGSRCWLGMTLGLGTTVGFSTKGLNSRCCPPAPPAAAFLLCTAWGYSLEQEETESPTRRPHLSHESPTPAPEAVAGTGTLPWAAEISLVLFPVSCPEARSSCISFHPKPGSAAGLRHSESTPPALP